MSTEAEIVTTGRGAVILPAAHAIMQFAVEARAASAAEAGSQNGELTRRVQGAIAALELADPALRVTSFRVSPEYTHDHVNPLNPQPRLSGYVARSQIDVTLRDIGRCGELLDAGLGAGATSAHEPRFVAEGQDEAHTRALHLAFLQARIDAEVLAVAAGASLGPVRYMSTVEGDVRSHSHTRYMSLAADMTGGAPDVRDDVHVGAYVEVRWSLVPGA